MNTNNILTNFNTSVTLNAEETDALLSVLISRPFRQGDIIVKAGDKARYLMFVNEGYVMTYFTDKEGADHVVQFASEGWWAGDVSSLGTEPNTPYATKALCDGELLLLPRPALEQLLEKHISIERYFRIFLHSSVTRHQMRSLENNTATAEERYQKFTATYPNMEQYVAQKYIASYLGITPEFLSKVRKHLSRRVS